MELDEAAASVGGGQPEPAERAVLAARLHIRPLSPRLRDLRPLTPIVRDRGGDALGEADTRIAATL